ncbi:MAG: FecR domain-containing protein [Gemmatimonadetes bacterium]|nr:FecR domain-containing protein [Gemmatimonadota bacterium]
MTNEPPHIDPHFGAEFWEVLARYLSDESPPEEAAAVRRWLAQDDRRGELVAALERSIRRVALEPPTDLDVEGALRRVRSRLHQPPVLALGPRERRWTRWSTLGLRAAAVVALAVGGALVWRASQRGGHPAASAVRDYATSVGEMDSIRLPDGSRVVLGPQSRLALAGGYGASAREVALSGEAWFDVGHDAARRFRVRAGPAVIEDLGTTFTIRTDGEEVRVVVAAGSVLLQDTSRAARRAALRAGDRGAVDRDGRVTVERGAATADDLGWLQRRLVFDNASMERVRADLRRWYGLELRMDSAWARRHLTASFAGEPAEQVLRAIGLALGARIERRGDTAFVRVR